MLYLKTIMSVSTNERFMKEVNIKQEKKNG